MAQKPKKTPAKPKAKTPRKTKPKGPGKRQDQYVERSREVEDEILARISAGELVRRICKDKHMPDAASWYRWLAQDEDLQARYAMAKEAQVEAELDEIRDLADRPLNKDENGRTVQLTEEGKRLEIQRRRMQIEARRWRIPKLAPRKYGQKSELFLADHRTTPVSDMPDEALDSEIMDLMGALTGGAKGQTKH